MSSSTTYARSDCRLCGSTDLVEAFSFGETPLANAYLTQEELDKPEIFAPLTVNQCQNCRLVQLKDVVNPNILFSHYLYVSGTSPVFVAHFADYAKTIVTRFNVPSDSLVVDFGSNDGTLLSFFKEGGMRILGIDPAKNLAEEATSKGIPTVAQFFTPKTTRHIVSKYGKASVITANNVFGHIDNVVECVEAVKQLLAPEGVFVFEVQYLGDMIEHNLFDNVYHEHMCFFHLVPLLPFFERMGMRVFDVEHISTHGGSLRVYVGWGEGPHQVSRAVGDMVRSETPLNDLSTYRTFAQRIAASGAKLRALISDLKQQGKRVVGYGAPAKATTLCYAYGIDANMLEYIVDDAPIKQGRYMPGTHIPIKPSEMLYTDKPDACLILAWNFADSIVKNNRRFIEGGGVFVSPVPEPRILT